MKLISFMKQYKLNIEQLAMLLNIPKVRVVDILNGYKASPYEIVKIGRLTKMKHFINKPLSIKEILDEQKQAVESAKKKILYKVSKNISSMTYEEIEQYLDDLKTDSMYLGLLYANNNEDEKVLEEVRKRREL